MLPCVQKGETPVSLLTPTWGSFALAPQFLPRAFWSWYLAQTWGWRSAGSSFTYRSVWGSFPLGMGSITATFMYLQSCRDQMEILIDDPFMKHHSLVMGTLAMLPDHTHPRRWDKTSWMTTSNLFSLGEVGSMRWLGWAHGKVSQWLGLLWGRQLIFNNRLGFVNRKIHFRSLGFSFLNWSVIALQCSVSFCYITMWISYMCLPYIRSQFFFDSKHNSGFSVSLKHWG